MICKLFSAKVCAIASAAGKQPIASKSASTPTGLPPQQEAESQKTVQKAVEAAGNTKEAPDVKAGLNKSSESGNQYNPKVPEAPPPKPQTATQLAGGNGSSVLGMLKCYL